MPLIYFHTDKIYSHIIWQIIEDEKFFFSKFSLDKRELKIYNLKKTTSKKIEFLSVRYLLRLLKLKPNDLYYLKNGIGLDSLLSLWFDKYLLNKNGYFELIKK